MPQYRPQPTHGPQPGGEHGVGSNGGNNGGNNGGLNNLPEGCRIEYQTVHSIEEIEEEKEVCTPYTDTVCHTEYRQQCTPYQDQECKLVPKQKCETIYEEVCENLWRDVPEIYVEDVCETKYVKTCQKHWKTYPNGDKKWEDDPSKCEELPETECRPVEKTRNKPEQYRECNKVPKQNCYLEDVEECYPVTKQKCVDVPEDVCEQVTKDKCEIVHTLTPKGKATQKAVRVCDHENGSAPRDAGLLNNSVRKNDEPDSKDDGSRIGFTFSA